MQWTWLDIVVVVLGVLQVAAVAGIVAALLRIRRSATVLARRATSGKDPGMRLALNARERGVRMGGKAATIGLAVAGTYRAVRREPIPGMPVTYSSMLRGMRDGLGTLATLKTIKSFVLREKKLVPPPGPPSVRRRQPKPPMSRRIRDSLVPPILQPVLNQVPNIAFAVGLVRTVLDTVRKQQQQQQEGNSAGG